VRVATLSATTRWLTLEAWGDDALARVWEPDGSPAAEVPLRCGDSYTDEPLLLSTDAAGKVVLSGPPRGAPWKPSCKLVGSGASVPYARALPKLEVFELSSAHGSFRPHEPLEVTLSGAAGSVQVSLARLSVAPPAADPPADPWVPEEEIGLDGPKLVRDPLRTEDGQPVEERLHRRTVTMAAAGTVVRLPGQPAGRYRVRAVTPDGRSRSALLDLSVSPRACACEVWDPSRSAARCSRPWREAARC